MILGSIFFDSVIEERELNKPGILTCGLGWDKRTSEDKGIENNCAQKCF